jgi:hypothetical protein
MGFVNLPFLKRRRRFKSSQRTYNPGRNEIKHTKFSVAMVNALCIVLMQAYIIHL